MTIRRLVLRHFSQNADSVGALARQHGFEGPIYRGFHLTTGTPPRWTWHRPDGGGTLIYLDDHRLRETYLQVESPDAERVIEALAPALDAYPLHRLQEGFSEWPEDTRWLLRAAISSPPLDSEQVKAQIEVALSSPDEVARIRGILATVFLPDPRWNAILRDLQRHDPVPSVSETARMLLEEPEDWP
jgi:hypothetical protein